jgi:REP element-mobilizing transposase RayT
MGRRLRFIPEGGSLVEVTCRTVQGRYLMRPNEESRAIILGVLARAQRLYPLRIHAFAFLSNHYHLLLSVPDAHRLARFIQYLNANLAREIGRLVDWPSHLWARRYQSILISDETAAQIGRLRYVLSQTCKEGLVSSPLDWPGAHCAQALLDGSTLCGLWFDRTREYAARQRGESYRPRDFASEEILTLDPLPCWRHLDAGLVRKHIRDLLTDIEQAAKQENKRPIGHKALTRMRPHSRPKKMKKAPAPGYHCATRQARRELHEAYGWFYAAYRQAAEKLRLGDLTASFPEGSFPPPRPFVGLALEPWPG